MAAEFRLQEPVYTLQEERDRQLEIVQGIIAEVIRDLYYNRTPEPEIKDPTLDIFYPLPAMFAAVRRFNLGRVIRWVRDN